VTGKLTCHLAAKTLEILLLIAGEHRGFSITSDFFLRRNFSNCIRSVLHLNPLFGLAFLNSVLKYSEN
jgi:hypothetical protein